MLRARGPGSPGRRAGLTVLSDAHSRKAWGLLRPLKDLISAVYEALQEKKKTVRNDASCSGWQGANIKCYRGNRGASQTPFRGESLFSPWVLLGEGQLSWRQPPKKSCPPLNPMWL